MTSPSTTARCAPTARLGGEPPKGLRRPSQGTAHRHTTRVPAALPGPPGQGQRGQRDAALQERSLAHRGRPPAQRPVRLAPGQGPRRAYPDPRRRTHPPADDRPHTELSAPERLRIVHDVSRNHMERKTGFEPATLTLARWCFPSLGSDLVPRRDVPSTQSTQSGPVVERSTINRDPRRHILLCSSERWAMESTARTVGDGDGHWSWARPNRGVPVLERERILRLFTSPRLRWPIGTPVPPSGRFDDRRRRGLE